MSRVDVLAVMDAQIEGTREALPNISKKWRADCETAIAEMQQARERIAEVFAAAHASLAARDLADQMAADDRLRAALAACEPETPHEPV